MIHNPKCQSCPLHQGANTICLPGDGPKNAKVMIVGEAPGYEEDKQGKPFVGKSGQVLREELAKAGLNPADCYITNTVKCRPPENAKPKAGEIKACKQYLDEEIRTVKPEFIITLGSIPTKSILKKAKITEVHGQIIDVPGDLVSPGFKGIASFHPAYTLYDPSKLPIFQRDIRRIAATITGKKLESSKLKFSWRQIGPENLSEFFEDLDNCEWFSFDLETSGLNWFDPNEWITCLNMSFDRGGGSWVLPMTMPFSAYSDIRMQRRLIQTIARKLEKKKGVGHNAKFDNHWLWMKFGVKFPLDFDTMLASHCVDENRRHGLDVLATHYFDAPFYDIPLHWKQGRFEPNERTETNVRTVYRYGAKDAFYTLNLRPILEKELKEDRQVHRLFHRLVMRAARSFHRIELNGLYIRMKQFKDTRKQVARERDQALVDLNKMVGKRLMRQGVKKAVNWNSPDQVADVLFKRLKLPIIELTDGGKPSTGEATLIALKDKHPIANQLVKYRELEKFLGTYLDGWKELMHEGLVYFSYKLHGTVTGRYSSRLHQTPRDKRIRTTVDAPEGWTFVQGDFSQAELRVAAILSHDPELIHCYKYGIDVHWRTLLYVIQAGGAGEYVKPALETAHKLLLARNPKAKRPGFVDAIEILSKAGHKKCIEIWDGWKEARKKAKGINFGFLYSMREKKFIEYAKTKYGFEPTEQDAAMIRRAYFQLYRGLEPWHEKMRKLVKLDGYVRSLSGRLRRLPGITSADRGLRSECERQAINSPVQGFIGDFKAMALVELEEKLDWNRSRVVGEVHDSILFWVRTELLEEELPKIAAIMRNPELVKEFKIDLPVPIEVELEVGTWGKGKEWTPKTA